MDTNTVDALMYLAHADDTIKTCKNVSDVVLLGWCLVQKKEASNMTDITHWH